MQPKVSSESSVTISFVLPIKRLCSCKQVQKPGPLVYTIVLSKTKFENYFSEPKQHKIVFLVFKNVENRQPVMKCQTRSIQCQTRYGSYLAKSPWLLGSQVNSF